MGKFGYRLAQTQSLPPLRRQPPGQSELDFPSGHLIRQCVCSTRRTGTGEAGSRGHHAVRNTRRLSLTPAGHELYGKCRFLLGEFRDAEAAVHAATTEASGTLTITSTISCAKLHIVPILSEFRKRHPKLKVKIIGANRYYASWIPKSTWRSALGNSSLTPISPLAS